MNEEHTFPLPEVETHKLDNLREQLSDSETMIHATDRWIHENAPLAVVGAGLLGFVFGRCLKS